MTRQSSSIYFGVYDDLLIFLLETEISFKSLINYCQCNGRYFVGFFYFNYCFYSDLKPVELIAVHV